MAGDSAEEGSLEKTPTYSVAAAAALFIALSVLLERGIHWLKKYLKKTNQRPLRRVVDKLTEELMLLGFISLLLTVFQSSFSKICVSPDFARHMLPCGSEDYSTASLAPETSHVLIPWHKRRLLSGGTSACTEPKVPFISTEGLHQLHIFIFVLAIVHVCYSFLTVALGFLRVNNWKKWERETRCPNYNGKADLKKRYCDKAICRDNNLSFVDRYANHPWAENPVYIWTVCFFRQFVASVSREDYLTFRVGFLHNHGLGDSFNFRDYVIRSMEVDFRKVIGINWWLWAFVVIFLLLNINGWYTYFWASFIPLILVFILGTKQQHIIATLALNAKRQALASSGSDESIDPEQPSKGKLDITNALQLSDHLFWFDRPKLLLKILHFVVFQNSFELAFLIWLWASFGTSTCFFGSTVLLPIRIVAGFLAQLMAGYSTLPTYALISQMGTHLKETVFTKDVYEGLVGWRARAKKRSLHDSSDTSRELSDVSSKEQTVDGTAEESKEGSVESREAGTPGARRLASAAWRVGGIRASAQSAQPSLDPSASVERRCQRLYGKAQGLEKVKAAKVNPSPQ